MVKFNSFMFYIPAQSVGLLVVLCGLGCSPEEEVSSVVRIILSDSTGQKHDADIYREAFISPLKPEVLVLKGQIDESVAKLPHKEGKVLVNLFLERVNPLEAVKHAKYNWLMVNHEFVESPDHLSNIDVVLCKNKHAFGLMKKYKKKYNMKFKIYFTKFTTKFDFNINASKDFNLALHLAGKSPFKNTGAVLKSWLQNTNNPMFPKLIATCRPVTDFWGCLDDKAKPVLDQYNIKLSPIIKSQKMDIYTEFVDDELIKSWQSTAGYYVVPSSVEGYGHYINEGRAAGAVVVTTDAAPMNEYVEDGVSGFVVPVKESWILNEYSEALEHSIDENELTKVMEKVIALSNEDKLKIGKKAQEAFFMDLDFFKSRMKILVDSLIKSKDLSLVPDKLFAE